MFGDCGEPMLDASVIARIKFQQSYERRNWKGLNVSYAGVPGTSQHLNAREILMFSNEKDHIESQDKLLDFFIQVSDACSSSQFLSNNEFTKFCFSEKLKIGKDEKGNPIYDEVLLKRVNAVQASSAHQFTKTTITEKQKNPGLIYYKMLKCESKLVKFIFELNGLVSTDRHDWDVLWTHTTGKSYFYERLKKEQKVNHFPVSIELTRKDNMVINIRRMKEKFIKNYFNFVPETFLMPDDYPLFIEHF